MNEKEFLESLAPGAEVAMSNRYGTSFGKVKRLTKNYIVIENEYGREDRFKRESGRSVGGGAWDSVCLKNPTPKFKHNLLVNSVRNALIYSYKLDLTDKTEEQILQCHAYLKGNGFIK